MSHQWFDTKAGALVNGDEIAIIYAENGKVWASMKRGVEEDVQLAAKSIMDLRERLLRRKVVI